jgi:glycosyltransferase involved in cell wall biosynthesis
MCPGLQPRRLKVLMSAYACEPGKGSEPEVGWQWALHMARLHDVTVLTRTNNRTSIEPELARLRGKQPLPQFVYHDERPALLDLKRGFKAHKLYYLLWQRSAREVVAQLNRTHHFDLLHHVTFAGFRFPTAIWGHGVPCIWGPIGGMESIPFRLLPLRHPQSLAHELGRNYNNALQTGVVNVFAKRARATTTILTSTGETRATLLRLGFETELMPTIGLDVEQFPAPPSKPIPEGPLKLLFVGNIITVKGVDLALRALKASGTNARFTLIGGGNFLAAAQRLAEKLELTGQVEFRPRIPREQVLQAYREYDVFLFPSLHDSGGYAVIEAMLNRLPVICLDCGGPAIAVETGCGLKVPLSSQSAVISNLASAIQHYDQEREMIRQHGTAARESILNRYDWRHKAGRMNAVYAETIQKAGQPGHEPQIYAGYSGVGSVPVVLSKLFSSRGVMTLLMVLLVVGLLGFLSTNYLRSSAGALVERNLPSLSSAGSANATLAQGFNRTVLLALTDDAARQAELQSEIRDFSRQTSQHLSDYEKQIVTPAARQKFDHLKQVRDEYIQIRDRLITQMQRGEKAAARKAINTELLPAYDRYREAGEAVLSHEIAEGRQRGEAILQVGAATQIVVALVSIVLFLLGFFIGIFK